MQSVAPPSAAPINPLACGHFRMWQFLTALGLGLAIGAGCRWFDLPLPAPPRLVGALLVLAMTLGYLAANGLSARPL